MVKQLKCPTCKKVTTWENNPFRPFCCERCKLIDLGKWADGSYQVPGEPVSTHDLNPEDFPELLN
ncbi:MAG: DNA gyrase inhibitor YacG [Candidatus Lambdaproteobacteria bacterium RIFOXYD12_FULL_49_8]|uniref:DNA gyrase inhibitor YacG n=1 Tax=Candidatus Lambdaproteobacteria bacterium RIFOXYD2_FULL_50_16 TaxID=1817772 RepID=A0A1F6GA71_9PROT|nr:MAG: DNA gyrase inhibitor YacG [Candidatus Lambdaproteobacteria bacterium RIFOXYD2_FULL_50_16]OGG98053.1 MAG: DNA gyrase inhibitor YacG [Candidatus Lambdaproteobacteria bacterium RIFOXYD12_FULL_49_8]